MSKIYEIYGSDAHEMTKALMKSANIAGGNPVHTNRLYLGAERCVTGCPPTASAIVQQFRSNQ